LITVAGDAAPPCGRRSILIGLSVRYQSCPQQRIRFGARAAQADNLVAID
jgi:hypothetical protein